MPPFDSLRVPARFLVMVVLFGGVLSGFRAQAVLDRAGHGGALVLSLLLVASVADLGC